MKTHRIELQSIFNHQAILVQTFIRSFDQLRFRAIQLHYRSIIESPIPIGYHSIIILEIYWLSEKLKIATPKPTHYSWISPNSDLDPFYLSKEDFINIYRKTFKKYCLT